MKPTATTQNEHGKDAVFDGVVEKSGVKFQYYQDRNKRWPFTCSEKGCASLSL